MPASTELFVCGLAVFHCMSCSRAPSSLGRSWAGQILYILEQRGNRESTDTFRWVNIMPNQTLVDTEWCLWPHSLWLNCLNQWRCKFYVIKLEDNCGEVQDWKYVSHVPAINLLNLDCRGLSGWLMWNSCVFAVILSLTYDVFCIFPSSAAHRTLMSINNTFICLIRMLV